MEKFYFGLLFNFVWGLVGAQPVPLYDPNMNSGFRALPVDTNSLIPIVDYYHPPGISSHFLFAPAPVDATPHLSGISGLYNKLRIGSRGLLNSLLRFVGLKRETVTTTTTQAPVTGSAQSHSILEAIVSNMGPSQPDISLSRDPSSDNQDTTPSTDLYKTAEDGSERTNTGVSAIPIFIPLEDGGFLMNLGMWNLKNVHPQPDGSFVINTPSNNPLSSESHSIKATTEELIPTTVPTPAPTTDPTTTSTTTPNTSPTTTLTTTSIPNTTDNTTS